MEIHHKIKPLHGWREFIGEVGIIVFGVLIALGAEQVVEAIHWRERVEAGRDALSSDFTDIFAYAWERELASRCIGRRLAEIAVILDDASRTGRLPPVGNISSPPKRSWTAPAWSSLVAAGTSAHFSRNELLGYAGIADYGRIIAGVNDAEFDDWAALHAIVGPGRRLGDAEEAKLRGALASAGYHGKLMRLAAYQIKQGIKGTGIPLDANFAEAFPVRMPKLIRALADSTMCKPIGPAPAHYGSSPIQVGFEGRLK